jgi:hypothetical protein
MKYWEIIADKIAASGWTWGYCTVAANGLRYIVDAHCGDGRRFIVESDELLSAFLEVEATLVSADAHQRPVVLQAEPNASTQH